jgi:hypothetical protein
LIKSNSAKYIVILLLFVACAATPEKTDQLPIENGAIGYFTDFEDFMPEFSKHFTHELKHYQYGLKHWKSPYYKEATAHFPDTLYSKIGYEFIYIAPVLQGQSSIRLKLKFENQKQAEAFYAEKIDREIEMEFTNIEEYKDSWYCYPDEFGFLSHYNLNNNCEVKLFLAPKCVGQGGGDLGGIASGIAIDKSANIVICWASDLRL